MNQLGLILENIRLSHIEKVLMEAQTEAEANRGISLINESMNAVYGNLVEEVNWKNMVGSALIGGGLATTPSAIDNIYQNNYSPAAKQMEQRFFNTAINTPGLNKDLQLSNNTKEFEQNIANLPKEKQINVASKIISNPKILNLYIDQINRINKNNDESTNSAKKAIPLGAAAGLGLYGLMGFRRIN